MTPSKDCKIFDCLSGLCLLETEFIENENSLEAGFHVKNKIVPQPTPCPNKSCLEGKLVVPVVSMEKISHTHPDSSELLPHTPPPPPPLPRTPPR